MGSGIVFQFFAVMGFCLIGTAVAYSQSEPPLPGLPVDEETATATTTVSASVEETVSLGYSALVASTATSASQTAVDDAETGPELIALAVFSLIGGFGLFCIKKYFDLKRYEI